jgi:hypothetical protein
MPSEAPAPRETAREPEPQPGIRITDIPASTPAPPAETAEASLPDLSQPAAAAPAPERPRVEPAPESPQETEAAPGFSVGPETTPAAASPPGPGEGLADIASVVNALPAEEARTEPAPEERRPEAAPPAPAQTPAAAPSPERAAQAHPRRHWVQIAGGANRAALPGELVRLRGQAPELVGRSAYTTPANATNRLLVGPFGSEREAQEFVNQLAQRQVAAFAWTSPPGQEIHRLTGR